MAAVACALSRQWFVTSCRSCSDNKGLCASGTSGAVTGTWMQDLVGLVARALLWKPGWKWQLTPSLELMKKVSCCLRVHAEKEASMALPSLS